MAPYRSFPPRRFSAPSKFRELAQKLAALQAEVAEALASEEAEAPPPPSQDIAPAPAAEAPPAVEEALLDIMRSPKDAEAVKNAKAAFPAPDAVFLRPPELDQEAEAFASEGAFRLVRPPTTN